MYLAHLKSKYPHILESIKKHKRLQPEVDAELRTILIDFIPSAGLKMKGTAN